MNTERILRLFETVLFEATLADYGWQAAVLDGRGRVGGIGPDHVAAWTDFGRKHDIPDHDLDGREDDEGFVDAEGEYHTRSQALLAWRRDYHDSLKKSTGWHNRNPVGDPGDSCDLKVDIPGL